MPERDAVVVGSGPNGLAAAIELARHDLDVLLIEAKDTIGGGTRTAELTLPGFRHDICAAVLPTSAASPYFSSLPLHEHGLEWVHPDLPVAQPLPGGDVAAVFPDLDETADHFGVDGRAYRKLIKPFVRSAEALIDGVLNPVLGVPRSPIVMARFGAVGARSAQGLASRFSGDRARATVAGAAAHSITSLDSSFTAALPIVFSALA
ncbi:MAG: NAD(P)/FAD-dependent oxidoreductase, partial [Acidimicrobiia bacterium]|nr:NAD(P)/FAD-dependent oxidoreductase [Acidimicrobiia bacterium]NNC91237.1 NAD(P)/FAD-dependent oxidoreductase [Acidimicrobiia bacterium]